MRICSVEFGAEFRWFSPFLSFIFCSLYYVSMFTPGTFGGWTKVGCYGWSHCPKLIHLLSTEPFHSFTYCHLWLMSHWRHRLWQRGTTHSMGQVIKAGQWTSVTNELKNWKTQKAQLSQRDRATLYVNCFKSCPLHSCKKKSNLERLAMGEWP